MKGVATEKYEQPKKRNMNNDGKEHAKQIKRGTDQGFPMAGYCSYIYANDNK